MEENNVKQRIFGRPAKLFAGALVLLVFLVSLATFLDRWYESRYSEQLGTANANANPMHPGGAGGLSVTEIDPPTDVYIFTERVPMENWEVRERFERELYYNFSNADQLLLWWKRSQRIFPRVEKALQEAGIPTDFKYLMLAESGLRNVKSPANANGFWQFVPGTATRYGLRVDDLIDDRLDPDRATAGAVKYLQKMKAEIPTWTMVAAGYNMGEENVHQVTDWQHQNSYWNLFINEETMRYVLRIAAIKELMEHGERYGLNFARTRPFYDPQTRIVEVKGPIPALADWAIAQSSSYKDIKTFNPWIIGRSLPEGTFQVKLAATENDKTTIVAP
jgi:membrane-bound lytic murein transglycosylase D